MSISMDFRCMKMGFMMDYGVVCAQERETECKFLRSSLLGIRVSTALLLNRESFLSPSDLVQTVVRSGLRLSQRVQQNSTINSLMPGDLLSVHQADGV